MKVWQQVPDFILHADNGSAEIQEHSVRQLLYVPPAAGSISAHEMCRYQECRPRNVNDAISRAPAGATLAKVVRHRIIIIPDRQICSTSPPTHSVRLTTVA